MCALLEKATAGRLHEVRRPPRRKQQPTTKPTEHSVTRLLAVANDLATRAAEQLSELLQQQQRSTHPTELPSTLLQQVSELHQLAEKLQQAATASRAPAAAALGRVTAAVQSGAACCSSSSSSSDASPSALVTPQLQSCFSSNLGPSVLPVLQRSQHRDDQTLWAQTLSERFAPVSLLDLPVTITKVGTAVTM